MTSAVKMLHGEKQYFAQTKVNFCFEVLKLPFNFSVQHKLMHMQMSSKGQQLYMRCPSKGTSNAKIFYKVKLL